MRATSSLCCRARVRREWGPGVDDMLKLLAFLFLLLGKVFLGQSGCTVRPSYQSNACLIKCCRTDLMTDSLVFSFFPFGVFFSFFCLFLVSRTIPRKGAPAPSRTLGDTDEGQVSGRDHIVPRVKERASASQNEGREKMRLIGGCGACGARRERA